MARRLGPGARSCGSAGGAGDGGEVAVQEEDGVVFLVPKVGTDGLGEWG